MLFISFIQITGANNNRQKYKKKGKGVMVTYWLESGRRAGGVGGVGSIGSQQTSSIGNQSSFNELEKDVPIQDEFRQSAKHRTEYSSFNDHNNNNTNTNNNDSHCKETESNCCHQILHETPLSTSPSLNNNHSIVDNKTNSFHFFFNFQFFFIETNY